MKTAPGIALCFGVFLVVGAVIVAYRYRAGDFVKRVGWVTFGAVIGIAVALVMMGPGNLWPIVIVFDAAVVGGGALIGGVIAKALRGRHVA